MRFSDKCPLPKLSKNVAVVYRENIKQICKCWQRYSVPKESVHFVFWLLPSGNFVKASTFGIKIDFNVWTSWRVLYIFSFGAVFNRTMTWCLDQSCTVTLRIRFELNLQSRLIDFTENLFFHVVDRALYWWQIHMK